MVCGPIFGALNSPTSFGMVAFVSFIILMVALIFMVLRPASNAVASSSLLAGSAAVGVTSAQRESLRRGLLVEDEEYRI